MGPSVSPYGAIGSPYVALGSPYEALLNCLGVGLWILIA